MSNLTNDVEEIVNFAKDVLEIVNDNDLEMAKDSYRREITTDDVFEIASDDVANISCMLGDESELDNLPDEVLEKILFYLDPVSQLNADLVSKRWNSVLGNWHTRIHKQKEADCYLDSSLKSIDWDPVNPKRRRDKLVCCLLESEKYWLSKPQKIILTSISTETRFRISDPGSDFVIGISSFVVYKEKLFVSYANNTISLHTAFSFRKIRDLFSSPSPHLIAASPLSPEKLISLALNRNTLAALIPEYNRISVWSAKTESLIKSIDLHSRIFEGLCISSTAMFVIHGRTKICVWSLDSENPQLGISECANIVLPVVQQQPGKMLIAANNHRMAFAVPELRGTFHTIVTSHSINQLMKWKNVSYAEDDDNFCVSGRVLSMALSAADLLAFFSRGSKYSLGTILTILKMPDENIVWKSKVGFGTDLFLGWNLLGTKLFFIGEDQILRESLLLCWHTKDLAAFPVSIDFDPKAAWVGYKLFAYVGRGEIYWLVQKDVIDGPDPMYKANFVRYKFVK